MLYFWITTAVHRARQESTSSGRFGSKPKGRMRRKNHFSSESSLDKMGSNHSPNGGSTPTPSGVNSSPSKSSSPSPLVGPSHIVSYSRSSSGGSTTLPEKSVTGKRKSSTTSLNLWLLKWKQHLTDLCARSHHLQALFELVSICVPQNSNVTPFLLCSWVVTTHPILKYYWNICPANWNQRLLQLISAFHATFFVYIQSAALG